MAYIYSFKTYMNTYIHTNDLNVYTHTHTHNYSHTNIFTYIPTYMHSNTYISMFKIDLLNLNSLKTFIKNFHLSEIQPEILALHFHAGNLRKILR